MGGTVNIDKHRYWLVAGWIYDNVLERLAALLDPSNPSLAIHLRENLLNVSVGYLDLEHSPRADLIDLVRATSELYRRTAAEGPKSFGDPRFFPGFLRAIANLRDLLAEAIKDRPAQPP